MLKWKNAADEKPPSRLQRIEREIEKCKILTDEEFSANIIQCSKEWWTLCAVRKMLNLESTTYFHNILLLAVQTYISTHYLCAGLVVVRDEIYFFFFLLMISLSYGVDARQPRPNRLQIYFHIDTVRYENHYLRVRTAQSCTLHVACIWE